jgi:hypothetical protein
MPTVVIGDNTGDDYSGTEDVQIKSAAPNSNYSSGWTTFEISKYGSGDHAHVLLSFSGLSNITGNITVSAASINIYREGGSSGTRHVVARRVLRNWVESQVTWNIYSTGNNWTTGGCQSDGNDRVAASSGAATVSGNGYITITDSQFYDDIEYIISGSYNNYGWICERSDDGEDGQYDIYWSAEGTDGNRPYLSVTYEEGGTGNSYYYQQQQM